MHAGRLVSALFFAAGLWGQPPRPEFFASRVIPSFGDTPLMLAPGILVSIYGDNLGPAEGCRGYGDQQHWETQDPDTPFRTWGRIAIYPTQLCDVQVKIGEVAVGLLWVQEKQINFQVPKQVPFEASAELRVIRGGVVSDPVSLEFGLERMTLTRDEPAYYTGMPIWIRVHTNQDLEDPIHYPFNPDPIRFACEQLEARLNGVPLPKIVPKNPMGGIGAGNICGEIGLLGQRQKTGRLPFHLMFRFDQPGAYEVRFTRTRGIHTILDRSAWTAIQVLPATKNQRAEWLREMTANAPKDPVVLLSDFLPSILGDGDAASLPLLVDYLYDPDALVQEFVKHGLADYYDKATLVPALKDGIRRKGQNKTVAAFLEFLTN
jgi:hypothetical protein